MILWKPRCYLFNIFEELHGRVFPAQFLLPSVSFFPLYESAEDKGAVELVSANVHILTNRLRLQENYFFVKIQPLMYHAWIFLFEEKAMFYSQDIQLLMILINSKSSQTSKSVTSSQSLMYIRKYTFDYSFRILGNDKMKFGQIVEQLMANISNLFLALLICLNTSSLSFHNFGKIATCSDL